MFSARKSKVSDPCLSPKREDTNIEEEFVDMLNAMRYGEVSQQTAKELWALARRVTYNDGIEPTEM